MLGNPFPMLGQTRLMGARTELAVFVMQTRSG